jgi:PRTRC genetic system ThiF family protein
VREKALANKVTKLTGRSRKRPPRAQPGTITPAIDLSFLKAARVIIRDHRKINLWLSGAGGTGSFLALNLVRLAHVLEELGREVRVLIVDPDQVEEGNVPRSNFSYSEIGQPKAQTLSLRYSEAWGVQVSAIRRKFHPQLLWQHAEKEQLTVLIGAVDNPAARRTIARALKDARDQEGEVPSTWWLDCGNSRETGQVLLGSEYRAAGLRGAFPTETLCRSLPSPALQHPDLLREQAEPLRRGRRLSCMELMLEQEQSLMINQRVAAEAGDILMQLLLTRDLQRFATYFDVKAGVAHSLYTTPELVAKAARLRRSSSLLLQHHEIEQAADERGRDELDPAA